MADLTDKQKAWANAYLETFNKTEAARRAGYDGNDVTLASIGSENYRKPQIIAYISDRLTEKLMSADEALTRLADMARSNIADFARVESSASIELLRDKSHVIKKFKRKITYDKNENRYEEIELELYDAQAALVNVLKVHGRFKDIHSITTFAFPAELWPHATPEDINALAEADGPQMMAIAAAIQARIAGSGQ